MNCYYHAEAPAIAFCRTCGRAVCRECQRPENGTVFCPDHATVNVPPPGASSNPYYQPPAAGIAPHMNTQPWLAFALGWIPGVGAIYNGQYIKGLVHASIFGLIVSLLANNDSNNAAPLLGILLTAFLFYMPIEAFQTARKRQTGIPLDEWSSLTGAPSPGRIHGRNSAGPVILIVVGILFLLDTLDVIQFRNVGRFWPVLLIVAGAYMLYSRTTGGGSASYPAAPLGGSPSSSAEQEVRRD